MTTSVSSASSGPSRPPSSLRTRKALLRLSQLSQRLCRRYTGSHTGPPQADLRHIGDVGVEAQVSEPCGRPQSRTGPFPCTMASSPSATHAATSPASAAFPELAGLCRRLLRQPGPRRASRPSWQGPRRSPLQQADNSASRRPKFLSRPAWLPAPQLRFARLVGVVAGMEQTVQKRAVQRGRLVHGSMTTPSMLSSPAPSPWRKRSRSAMGRLARAFIGYPPSSPQITGR